MASSVSVSTPAPVPEAGPVVFGDIDCTNLVAVQCPHCGSRYRWIHDDYRMVLEAEKYKESSVYRLVSPDDDIDGGYNIVTYHHFCSVCHYTAWKKHGPFAVIVEGIPAHKEPSFTTLLIPGPNRPVS